MQDPEENAGKIFTSIFMYIDQKTGRRETKRRPVLIIGCEEDYSSPINVDYEILPISTMKRRRPDPNYDIFLESDLRKRIGLNEDSYLRTNKTSWHSGKHLRIESPVGDLKSKFPELFIHILQLNEKWVQNRNRRHL